VLFFVLLAFFCVTLLFFFHRAHSHSTFDTCQLSEYAQALTKEAKERYVEKLQKLGCNVDPYLESYSNEVTVLPTIKYSHIYDFIGNHTVDGNDLQRAFKSLDGYRMVVSSGWMGGLCVKKWPHATIIKCDVKPSQRSGVIYTSLGWPSSHVVQYSMAIAHAWLV